MISPAEVFVVNAMWGRRSEAVEVVTRRWMNLVDRLRATHAYLDAWEHYEEARGRVSYAFDFEEQLKRARDNMDVHVDGRVLSGTRLWLTCNPDTPSRNLDVSIAAGLDSKFEINSVMLNSSMFSKLDSELQTFLVFRSFLLASTETFGATQGVVWPSDIRERWADTRGISETLDLAWMTYVAPRFAHLVTPPLGVVVEHRPDGGLFMAATRDVFRTADPSHLAAAHRIRDVLAVYNAVPWTAESGK